MADPCECTYLSRIATSLENLETLITILNSRFIYDNTNIANRVNSITNQLSAISSRLHYNSINIASYTSSINDNLINLCNYNDYIGNRVNSVVNMLSSLKNVFQYDNCNIAEHLFNLKGSVDFGFSAQYNILGGIHGTINSRLGEVVVKLSDINSSMGSYETVNVVNDIIIDSNNYAYVGKGDMSFTDL